MAIYNLYLASGSPAKPTMETTPYSADLHKLYLKSIGSYGSSLVLNGGGDNTTDWVVSGTTQLGDYWSILNSSNYIFSIINAVNGFTDNAQRIVCNVGNNSMHLLSNDFGLTGIRNTNYRFWMKYRSSHQVIVYQAYNNRISGRSFYVGSSNTGNATAIEVEWSANEDEFQGIWMTMQGGSDSGSNVWLEIDEVMVKEVL